MFTEAERAELGARVVAALQADPRIERVDGFGPIANAMADRHSDVDLAAVVRVGTDPNTAADDWIGRMSDLVDVVHAFRDEVAGTSLSGFLLENHLEIDIAFGHAAVLATGLEYQPPGDEQARQWLDFAWHDVVHAAIAVERWRPLRALFYVDRMRDRAIVLACVRHGLDERHHKAADELPAETRSALAAGVPGSLEPDELRRALRAATRAFYAQTRAVDAEVSGRLEASLLEYLDELGADP